MVRAVLEGVAFGLCDSLDLIREQGIVPRQVRVSGGGARSELWRQILADVFGVEAATMNLSEGAALGAAILAGVGTAAFDSVADACERAIQVDSVISPNEQKAEVYRKLHEEYRKLYPALSPTFHSLSTTDEV
jgi:xylulokinase